MRILWEVKRYSRGRMRVVRKFRDGVILVITGDEECWRRYVCVPRRLVLANLRKKGRRAERWELYPEDAQRPSYYHGPGSSYSSGSNLYKRNRKYIVFTETGGLDI